MGRFSAVFGLHIVVFSMLLSGIGQAHAEANFCHKALKTIGLDAFVYGPPKLEIARLTGSLGGRQYTFTNGLTMSTNFNDFGSYKGSSSDKFRKYGYDVSNNFKLEFTGKEISNVLELEFQQGEFHQMSESAKAKFYSYRNIRINFSDKDLDRTYQVSYLLKTDFVDGTSRTTWVNFNFDRSRHLSSVSVESDCDPDMMQMTGLVGTAAAKCVRPTDLGGDSAEAKRLLQRIAHKTLSDFRLKSDIFERLVRARNARELVEFGDLID